jgi:hypothetical protein
MNTTQTLVRTIPLHLFNSTGRLFPVTFMIDNQLIEKVKQYRYLGVMFDASGSFSDAKEELYKRGLKALFKMTVLLLVSKITKNNININNCIELIITNKYYYNII